ncbi:MAG TPA: hypothetical protein DGT21_03900 [Armatimonadetes bacterium]|nr:hypothetical protein [Armatimonadota bacterium]
MGCRREQAQPEQIVIEQPPSPPPEPPPPPPLPEEAGVITLTPAPEEVSSRLRAEGEIVVMQANGAVHHSKAGGPLRKLGRFIQEDTNGCCLASAQWSPEGRQLLFDVDIWTTGGSFLWDGRELIDLEQYLEQVYGGLPWPITWFDEKRMIATGIGRQFIVAPARPTARAFDDFEWFRPTDGAQEYSTHWTAPDRSYIVAAFEPAWEDRHPQAALYIIKPGEGMKGPIDASMYPNVGRLLEIDGRVVWQGNETDRFLVRTERNRVVTYGADGEQKATSTWGEHEVGPATWGDTDWPSPDLGRVAALDEDGTLWVLGQNTSARALERGGPSVNCLWSPDARWLACVVDVDSGEHELLLYDAQAHTIRSVAVAPRLRKGPPLWYWSPNSRYLAYIGHRDTETEAAYVVDLEQCSLVEVSGGVKRGSDDRELKVHPQAWTTDGGHLVYSLVRVPQAAEVERTLWIASADGTHRRKLLDLKWQCDVSCGPPPV